MMYDPDYDARAAAWHWGVAIGHMQALSQGGSRLSTATAEVLHRVRGLYEAGNVDRMEVVLAVLHGTAVPTCSDGAEP